MRCIRKPFPGHLHRPAVTIGSDYVVLMVSATPDSRIVLRILENRREEVSFQKPILRDSRDFELVSSAIPNNWRVAIDERAESSSDPHHGWMRASGTTCSATAPPHGALCTSSSANCR